MGLVISAIIIIINEASGVNFIDFIKLSFDVGVLGFLSQTFFIKTF